MATAAYTGLLPVHPSIPETCRGTPWTYRSKMAGSPDNFAPARLERAARRVPRPLPGGCHHMADRRGSGSLPALLCCCWLASCTPWHYCKLPPPPHLHSRHSRQLRQQNSAEKAAEKQVCKYQSRALQAVLHITTEHSSSSEWPRVPVGMEPNCCLPGGHPSSPQLSARPPDVISLARTRVGWAGRVRIKWSAGNAGVHLLTSNISMPMQMESAVRSSPSITSPTRRPAQDQRENLHTR